MKILYAVQGTGNGHISRAMEIVPILQKYCELDILISGIQADLDPGFMVTHRLKGMGFIFGKKGEVDLIQTFRKCISRGFIREIKQLPLKKYDLVINDFEPVSAWAARIQNVPCISLSHQFAVIHSASPKPDKTDWVGKMIMSNYSPVSSGFGFHFKPYAETIFTPVIRSEVRNLSTSDGQHITVYLPAYSNEQIIKVLSLLPSEEWQVFSKHSKKTFQIANISIQPITNKAFLESMASSKAVLCGAGFETPAEALFLGKKLLVIPMKNQYEQQCNAAALAEMGIRTLKNLKRKYVLHLKDWIAHSRPIPVSFPDQTEEVIRRVLDTLENQMPMAKRKSGKRQKETPKNAL